MINQKAEIESQDMIEAEESVSSHQENRGNFESKKKMKKVRSMKLQRLSSRGRKSQHDHKVSIFSSVGTVGMADPSPNYMKGTSSSSSHAKDQIEERVTTNKSLTRVTTLKVKRSLSRKLSGRTEQNRKLKSSRSIKVASVKGPKSSTLYSDSESIHGSDGKNRDTTSDAGNKSQRIITRRLSLKPVRISSKKPSLHKATCSSTIKDSHFPDQIDLPQEGSSSQGVSAVRVCPYTYCSLHGHHHGDLPPLKRFVFMTRRQLKTQKSVKKDGRSKQIGNARQAAPKTKTIQSEDGNSHFQNAKNLATDSSPFKSRDTSPSTVNEGDTSTKDKNMEPDYEVLQKSFAQEEPKPGSTTSVAYGLQERDQKYIKKWHLMYKHAVLSNTGKCENKVPFVEKDKKAREEEDALAFNGGNTYCHSYSETDSDMDDEKQNVIELVQKAFDEILLPEAEDLSSDDHSKSRDNKTDEVLLDKSEGKIEERNATTFMESPKELQKMESKPKNWSHLKKVILLKRFVKALEKVRNINPRRPRELPSDANFEVEKVLLNRQTSEERKQSEEWMLDYAIQKVISKLAPVQRQKVTLLIEAFETIRPFQDADNGPRSTATVESQENPSQSVDASSNHSKEEINDGRDFEVTESARNDKNMTACNENDENATVESTSTDAVKFPVFNEILEDEVTTKGENMEPDHKVPQKIFVQEEPNHGSSNSSTAGVPYRVQEGDQKYIKKWHLMYKHAVLSNTGKCKNELPFVGKDKEGREEDDVTFNGGKNSCHYYSETDSDMDDEKKNVIQLVQKAFDEILLQEIEDLSSDDHSKSRSYGSEEVLLEKSEGKQEEETNTTTFTESTKEAQKMENKPKSWSHLKKLIILKRFVKALDKVRNINPRRPRQLPSDANFEAEKVFLNRHTSEESKKSEEWMLDYALQKVISKLAPAQRQKVTLLIEAFETLRPFQDAETGPRSTATVESQENPIQSLDASSNHSKEEINDRRDFEVTDGARSDKNMTACNKNDESAAAESTSTDVVKFPVFNVGILEEGVTTKGGNMEPDHKVPQEIFVQEEHGSSTTTGVPNGVQEGDQKYIKKWHLMYKHAVLSNTGKYENEPPFGGKDNEDREEDDVTFNGGRNSSCHNYSETDSDMDDEKKNVIQLVQNAFDEILLPEIEDLSSDDHSKSRSYGSEEVLLEKSEGKQEEETNTTTFTESTKEAQKMENKPKSWSHLKKLILLKRFVKALDKVRNINPRRPRQLPSDANFEAEKVFLNRQTSEERKKSEEWMLDYALQKVISKLAPAQRQKVTLLIEAFETLRPFQDAETGPRSTATVESQENPIQSLDASSNHSKEEINDGRDFEVTDGARSDKNMTACNKNDESAAAESTSTDVVKFPVFNVGILEEGATTKGNNMEPDHKVPQEIFVQEEHGSSTTTGVPNGVQEGDQKYIKKWHLMYKHAVLNNTGKYENEPPFGGKDNEDRKEDDVTFNGGRNSSCHNYSETDSDMDDEKKNVIELVQKAFDEILLPEAEDLSSDDNSNSRSYGSEDVLLEKSDGKEEERNTTTFTESTKEAQKMENKPKSWSYLKKLILLKRFVKALDKVTNINPRRPRQLPSDANFEAEKVFLNRQTAEERKKSEEWMLDYALQKVISKLAPAQRQKVRLLIEAFETIRPFQDAEKGPRSQENPVQSLDAASNHRKEEINEERDSVYLAKSLLGKVSCSNDSTKKVSDKGSENPMHELCNSIKPVETVSSCHEEAPTNGIVEEVPEDLASDLNAEKPSIKSESPGRYRETKNVIGDNSEQLSLTKSLILNGLVRSLKANLVVPEASSNQLDEPTRGRKDMIEKDQLETSEAPTSAVVESETQVEKQGNTGLWFMVYKHMVSDMTENNSKTLTDVADEKVSKYEGSITRENSVSDESTPVINQDMHLEDRDVELRQIEAIKMVEEAIDSILPDRQPLTDNNTIDRTERMYSGGLNQKEEKMESGNGIAAELKEESVPKEGNKPSQKFSRNWSNLRKVVLLKRFIKALEKVRKFNPRGPRYLPLEADSEDEKVQLRHQDMAERKGTEEWMLDYALRQVVSELTPARKRKVELLVEAFETVKK